MYLYPQIFLLRQPIPCTHARTSCAISLTATLRQPNNFILATHFLIATFFFYSQQKSLNTENQLGGTQKKLPMGYHLTVRNTK